MIRTYRILSEGGTKGRAEEGKPGIGKSEDSWIRGFDRVRIHFIYLRGAGSKFHVSPGRRTKVALLRPPDEKG
jgi:hypothetical protein